MTTYSDLTQLEKLLFNKIENIYIDHPSVTGKSFVKVLFLLGNKHKVKK